MRIKSKLLRFHGDSHGKHFYSQEQLQDALESIDKIADVASINNDLKPFRVLGLTAETALAVSIVTTAISFYSIVFSMYSTSSSSTAISPVQS
jgi:hypothetical protein